MTWPLQDLGQSCGRRAMCLGLKETKRWRNSGVSGSRPRFCFCLHQNAYIDSRGWATVSNASNGSLASSRLEASCCCSRKFYLLTNPSARRGEIHFEAVGRERNDCNKSRVLDGSFATSKPPSAFDLLKLSFTWAGARHFSLVFVPMRPVVAREGQYVRNVIDSEGLRYYLGYVTCF